MGETGSAEELGGEAMTCIELILAEIDRLQRNEDHDHSMESPKSARSFPVCSNCGSEDVVFFGVEAKLCLNCVGGRYLSRRGTNAAQNNDQP